MHPAPTAAELVAIYNTDKSSIANSDSWVQVEDFKTDPEAVRGYYRRSRITPLLEAGALRSKSDAILDVGCSAGMFLRTLKDDGYANVHGMDLADLHCDFVRDVQGIPCDSTLEVVPDGAFDLVTCHAVLEHTPDPVAFARLLTTKLKPGGLLVINVPNFDSYYRRLAGRSWLWLIPPVHLQYFGHRSLERTLAAAGLETTNRDSWYFSTYVYLLVYHAMRMLGRQMPTTQRTSRPAAMVVVNAVEAMTRAFLYPIALVARRRLRHNELVFVSRKGAGTAV